MEALFILLQKVAPQHLLSRLAGLLADSKLVWWKNLFIRRFVARYAVDLSEAEFPRVDDYPSFNAFFTRALRTAARPIYGAADAIVCPADGTISQIGNITQGKIFQAKGHDYSARTLLGDAALAEKFVNGKFATIYLSPRDYHRVHMPITGKLLEMLHVPGSLYSVNSATANNIPELFARNERMVALFETALGPMAVVMVGAMIVASIETVWAGMLAPGGKSLSRRSYLNDNIVIDKGLELGRFKLGSTVILLFPENSMSWNDALTADFSVQMGQKLGFLLR